VRLGVGRDNCSPVFPGSFCEASVSGFFRNYKLFVQLCLYGFWLGLRTKRLTGLSTAQNFEVGAYRPIFALSPQSSYTFRVLNKYAYMPGSVPQYETVLSGIEPGRLWVESKIAILDYPFGEEEGGACGFFFRAKSRREKPNATRTSPSITGTSTKGPITAAKAAPL